LLSLFSLQNCKTMESSNRSPFDSFKSKKILRSSSSNPSPSDQPTKPYLDPNLWSSEKPVNHPGRALNHRTAMSVKEVREFAEKLHKPDRGRFLESDPGGSDGHLIGSGRDYTPIAQRTKKVDDPINLPEN
ncbi:Acyl-lipid (8-3)-desaturase, partial [Actinidia chinensis var. chinensis]